MLCLWWVSYALTLSRIELSFSTPMLLFRASFFCLNDLRRATDYSYIDMNYRLDEAILFQEKYLSGLCSKK